jgi:hypothetical protein
LNEELGARIVQCKENDPRNYEQGMFNARKAGFKESLMQRRSEQGRFNARKDGFKESLMQRSEQERFDLRKVLLKESLALRKYDAKKF